MSNSLAARFDPALVRTGFVPLFSAVLDCWPKLGGTDSELRLVLLLWRYWWGVGNPCPAIATLAKCSGKSVRSVQSIIRSLTEKGLLVVTPRYTARGQTSSEYSLRPLLDKVVTLVREDHDLAPNGARDPAPAPVRSASPNEDEPETDELEVDHSNRWAATPVLASERPEESTAFAREPEPAASQKTAIIARYVVDFGREFRDKAPQPVSIARAVNLWRRSGKPVDEFVAAMLEARVVTQRHSGGIRSEGDRPGQKRKMGYWFAVLQDCLDKAA